jgi:hypothetical protein
LHLSAVGKLQLIRFDANGESVGCVTGESADAVAGSYADSLMNGE